MSANEFDARAQTWDDDPVKLARAVSVARAIRQQVSVDEALAALDRDVDRILEKRRWLLRQGTQPSPPALLPPAGEGRER